MHAPTAPSRYQVFVGVDIAATTATAVWLAPDCQPPHPITIPQTTAGYAKLHQHLLALGYPAPTILVVLEATGTYWVTLATNLAQADFAIAVINPGYPLGEAHAFAKALLKRNKTDPIDAHTLAHLGAVLQPAVWTPPPPCSPNSTSTWCSGMRWSTSARRCATNGTRSSSNPS